MAENTGDRGMLEAMVRGAWGLAGAEADEEFIRRITEQIIPDTKSRFFHIGPERRQVI